jgi:hypothetical protein
MNSPTAGAFFHEDSVSSPSIVRGVEIRVATIVFGDSPPAHNGRGHRRSTSRYARWLFTSIAVPGLAQK